MNRNAILAGLLLMLLLAGPSVGAGYAQDAGPQAGPLGTAFTYQGRLSDGSGPVDGTCDLTFKLYDAAGSGSPPSGGTLLGTQTVNDVLVADGYFVVQLDFGAGAFAGPSALAADRRGLWGRGDDAQPAPAVDGGALCAVGGDGALVRAGGGAIRLCRRHGQRYSDRQARCHLTRGDAPGES